MQIKAAAAQLAAVTTVFEVDSQCALPLFLSLVNGRADFINPFLLPRTPRMIAEISGAPMRVPIIKIDTNQGIYGLGEVRDGGSQR